MPEKDTMVPIIQPPSQPLDGARPSTISRRLRKEKRRHRSWIVISALLIVLLLIVGTIGLVTWNWVRSLQISTAAPPIQKDPVTVLNIQRTAAYAGLNFTVLNAQYATTFADDTIRSGPAVIRLNMRVTNTSTDPASVVYYDTAHLLIPGASQIAPTVAQLAVGPDPGKSETGWLDFPVPRGVQLNAAALQLGSSTQNELLVTIPFTGAFNPGRYANRTAPQSLTISYDDWSQPGLYITYHLHSIGVQYSYKGVQCKAGQQIYVLNFTVDNPNGTAAGTGPGYNYVRLVLNGNMRPPFDSTLPSSFRAGARGVGGHVAFAAPAGLKNLDIYFLYQNGSQGQDYPVRL
ncbi:MAG: hypothetical protein ABI456_09245 [Ktedonobacteraceae bacterium]